MKQGNLVVLPGLPAFYDYEWYPQLDDVRETLRYKKYCIHWNAFFQRKELPMSFHDFFKAGTE
jgi:hypothetical protein